MEFKIPHARKVEHDELQEGFKKAAMSGGKVGPAAREVAQALHAHFENEE